MIVKLTTEKSVFIEIDGRTYYIDHSLDEPIIEYWTEEKEIEVITLKPETDVTSTED